MKDFVFKVYSLWRNLYTYPIFQPKTSLLYRCVEYHFNNYTSCNTLFLTSPICFCFFPNISVKVKVTRKRRESPNADTDRALKKKFRGQINGSTIASRESVRPHKHTSLKISKQAGHQPHEIRTGCMAQAGNSRQSNLMVKVKSG